MLWAVKSIEHVNWVAGELQAGVTRLQCRGVEVSLRVFVTGTEDVGSSRIAGRGIEVPVGCTCECSTGQACECTVGLPRYEDIALGAQGEPQGSPRNSAGSLRHSSAGSQRGTAEGNGILDREHPSSSSGSSSSPNRSPSPLLNGSLDNVTISTGRPAIREILRELVDTAQGEVGVAVCGPLGMGVATRRAVAGLQGKGAEVGGLFLHVEGFAW
jgi:ferric-chelate reductase